MGCATGTPQARKMLRVHTLFGALHVKVINAHLDYNPNSVMTMDPYVKIIISNQNRTTQVQKKGGSEPKFDQDFVFAINSCYKPYGRSLELFVMDKNMIGSDSLVGYGLLDLDFLIKNDKDTTDMKIRLQYKNKQIGWANLKIRFQQLPIETLNFRFDSLDIISPSFQGSSNCWVKMTFGEEVFQTPKAKDTPQSPPLWNDQSYQVQIPACVTKGNIEVFDNKSLIGKVELDLSKFLKSTEQTTQKEQIKNDDGVATGKLKFSVIKGANVTMSQDRTNYTKASVSPSKKEEREKKYEEKGQNKPEPEKKQKKEEPKTEAPKEEQKASPQAQVPKQ